MSEKFNYGRQYSNHKNLECRARAVRAIKL